MTKLITTSCIILVIGFISCKKETVTSTTSQEEIATGKPPSNPPPPTSILQWQKCFGSSAQDIGNSIAINSTNDAYFICGNTLGNDGNVTGNHGGQDAWVVKTSLNGTLLGQVAIGSANVDEANGVAATADGGCVVVGQISSTDVFIAKISASATTIEWTKTFGGSGYDRAWALIKTVDGGFAIAGQTTSTDGDLAGIAGTNNNSKVWLIKLDNTANIEWQTTYQFEGAKDDVGYSLTQTSDGQYVIAGRTLSIDNNPDICVVKVNTAGAINWAKHISSSDGAGDVAFGVTASPGDGGCVVTGYLGPYNLLVEKLNIDGNVVWQKIFAGSVSGGQHGRAILSTSQGYIITGRTNSKSGEIIASKGGEDLFILQLDLDGKLNGNINILGGKNNEIGKSLVAAPDGAYIAIGQTDSNNGDVSGNHGGSDMWMVKFKF
jgi:hypothetical protein